MKPVVVIASLLLAGTSAVFGHDGEDHGAPPPAVSQTVLPRATASSEAFEMVAVLDGKRLVITLDRFASNEPVTGAKVEVEGGGLKGVAAESSPGVYSLDAAALTAAKHPLTIAIESGDSADLLSATLDTSMPPPEVTSAHAPSWREWTVWFGAGVK